MKRQSANSGVAAAVESCNTNTKSKHMVMFGLRTLSDLCTPPCGKFKENALDAVCRGIVTTLNQIFENLSKDTEIVELIIKVCWGISAGIKEYKISENISQFQESNGLELISNLFTVLPPSDTAIIQCFEMAEMFVYCGLEPNIDLVIASINSLLNVKLKPETHAKIFKLVYAFSKTHSETIVNSDPNIISKLLSFAATLSTNNDQNSVEAIYNILQSVILLAAYGSGDDNSVSYTEKIIDMAANPKIVEAACLVLTNILTLEHLKYALECINNPDSGIQDKERALELIGAMSYVDEFADAIVETGYLPLFVEAMKSTVPRLSEKDDVVTQNYVKTVSLLQKISKNKHHAEEINNLGGTAALVEAFASLVDNPVAFAITCLAISSIMKHSESFANLDSMALCLELVYNKSDDLKIQEGCLNIIHALSTFKKYHKQMIEQSVFEFVSYILQYNLDDTNTKQLALSILENLAPEVYTTSYVYEYGGFQGLSNTLVKHAQNPAIVSSSFNVLTALTKISDSKDFGSKDGLIVDAVLIAVSENPENKNFISLSQDLLEHFATEADAQRHAQNLSKALAEADQNPYSATKSLAATYGLSDIKRLSHTFEEVKAGPLILEHLHKLLKTVEKLVKQNSEDSKLMQISKILRLGMASVTRITLNSSGETDKIVIESLNLILTDALILLTRSNPEICEIINRNVIDIIMTDRITQDNTLEQCLVTELKCLNTYTFNKRITELNLLVLINLMSVRQGSGLAIIEKNHGSAAVITTMKQCPYHVRVQINGLIILNMIIQKTPDKAESIPKADTVKFLQSILRTFSKDVELRAVAAPVLSFFVSESELQKILSRNLDSLESDLGAKNYSNAIVVMRMSNDFLVGSASTRTLIRLNAPAKLSQLKSIDPSDPNYLELIAESAQMFEKITNQNIGINACVKEEYHLYLLRIAKDLGDARNIEACTHALNALANITTQNKQIHNSLLKVGVIDTLYHINKLYPDNASINTAICRILGGLATSDENVNVMRANPNFEKLIQSGIQNLCAIESSTQRAAFTEALVSINRSSSLVLTKIYLNHNILPILIKQLDLYSSEVELVEPTCCLINLLGSTDDKNPITPWQPDNLMEVSQTFANCLIENINDCRVCCSLINALARFGQFDERILHESNVLAALQRVILVHSDDENLLKQVQELLKDINGNETLTALFQELKNCHANNDTKGFLDAVENLNIMLLTPITDIYTVLADEEEIWAILNQQLQEARNENDLKRMRAIMTLAQRLINQGKNDTTGYHGAWYCSQHFLPQCFEILEQNHHSMDIKKFNVALINVFISVAQVPDTFDIVANNISVPSLLYQLRSHQNDPDIAASIITLLNILKHNPTVFEAALNERDPANNKHDTIKLFADIITRNKYNKIVLPAMEFVGTAASSPNITTSETLEDGQFISAVLRATAPNQEPNIDAETMKFYANCAKNQDLHHSILAENVLTICEQRLDATTDRRNATTAENSMESLHIKNHYEFARMVEQFGNMGLAYHVQEKNILQKLKDMLEEFEDNEMVHEATLAAILANTPQTYAKEFDDYYEIICNQVIEIPTRSQEDDEIRRSRANLVNTSLFNMLGPEEYERIKGTSRLGQILEYTDEVEEISQYYLVNKAQQMEAEAPTRFAVDPLNNDDLTLKQVHDWLVERLENDQTIDFYDKSEPILAERYLFVVEKLKEYNELMLTLDDFAGYQLPFGCKSLSLWLQHIPHSVHTMIEMEMHTILFNYLQGQVIEVKSSREKQCLVTSSCSQTLVHMCEEVEHCATPLAKNLEYVKTCIDNINICTSDPQGSYIDEHIIPRLELVQKMAVDRSIFKDNQIVLAVKTVWDYYDNSQYTEHAFRHALRALRCTACSGHTDSIITHSLLQRLILELKKDFFNPILVDGFFLLGIYSLDPRLKAATVKLNAVRESLTIFEKHFVDPPNEGVLVNCMLALANMIVDNSDNKNIFLKEGGLTLNTRIFVERSSYMDEVSAASALLTNACFRRDDIKESYGSPKINAPPALVGALSVYTGVVDVMVIRCLTNLFKAISNLALYPPNIDIFLNSKLEEAYYNLIKHSQELPNQILENGLFTLISLTSEFNVKNISKFGILVPPIVHMLRNPERHTQTLIKHTCDALIFICRDFTNSHTFCVEGGVPDLIVMFHKCIKEESQSATVILKLLATLARWSVCSEYLITPEVINLCKNIVEGHYYYKDDTEQINYEMAYLSFRFYRRLFISGGPLVVGSFGEAEGFATILWYLESLAKTLDPYLQLTLECLRVIIGGLAIAAGDNANEYLPITEHIGQLEIPPARKKRWFKASEPEPVQDDLLPPEGARTYEIIGLIPENVELLITSLTELSKVPSFSVNVPFASYALCILCYIVTEQIPNTSEIIFANINNIVSIIRIIFESHGPLYILEYYIAQIVANISYHNPEEFVKHFHKDSTMYRIYNELVKTIKSTTIEPKDKTMTNIKNKVEDVLYAWNSMLDGANESSMLRCATYQCDFCSSGWNIEQYPNGVQDLQTKDILRRGGSCSLIEDENTVKSIVWRSNKTLTMFQWCVVQEGVQSSDVEEYEFSVGINKLENIQLGLCTDFLRKASKKLRGVYNDTILHISGPYVEGLNSKLNLNLKFKNKELRNDFVSKIQDWIEASTN